MNMAQDMLPHKVTLKFEVVRISSAKEKSLLKYYGPKVWADIPLLIKNSQSLKVFIHSYRTHLIGNYSQYFD